MGLWFGKAFFWVDLFIFSLAEARRRRGGKFFEMGCGELDGVGFPKWRWLVDWGAWRGVMGRPAAAGLVLMVDVEESLFFHFGEGLGGGEAVGFAVGLGVLLEALDRCTGWFGNVTQL
jgi:hypothetical protein